MSLLEGICPEAAELLKDRQFATGISRVLRKMKPTRQVECVELMVSANTITVAYAEAMLVATPAAMLVEGEKPAKLTGLSQEQMAKMEREMSNLRRAVQDGRTDLRPRRSQSGAGQGLPGQAAG